MQKTSEIYKRVYHYTTWDGLLGILEKKTLWATHYKFLNDYSEIVLFRDKLISLILPLVRKAYEKLIKQSPQIKETIEREGGLHEIIRHDTEIVVDAQYRATGEEIYILSFCGEHKTPKVNANGLLSQWRGYGAGGGVALVFNTLKLEEILEIEARKFDHSPMHFSTVVYGDDEDNVKRELSQHLSVLAGDVDQLFNRMLGKEEKLDTRESYKAFVACITRYKHYGFHEENEVRVVVVLPSSKVEHEKERKYRKRNGQVVPYIELFNSTDIELPIERIIVGPHREKETRAAALRVMLRDTKIEIMCSEIPYVGYS